MYCTVQVGSVHCTLYTVHCTLYTVHCTVQAGRFILYTVYCTVQTGRCTLYTVYCTVQAGRCTLYTVYCTVQAGRTERAPQWRYELVEAVENSLIEYSESSSPHHKSAHKSVHHWRKKDDIDNKHFVLEIDISVSQSHLSESQ